MAPRAEVPVAFYPGPEYAPRDIRETAELLRLVFMGGYEAGNDGSAELKVEEWGSSEVLDEWSSPELHFSFRIDGDEPPPGVGMPVVTEEPADEGYDDGYGNEGSGAG